MALGAELISLIALYRLTRGARGGRPASAVQSMLCIHFLLQWFSLSFPPMREALYDTTRFREFNGLGMGDERLPYGGATLTFRHLLQTYESSLQILTKGLLARSGEVVNAMLIAAPNSSRNSTGEREPEMHQTKKGNLWRFGIKAHSGVDVTAGLVHTVVGTAVNVHEATLAHKLAHAGETEAFADASYQGMSRRKVTQGDQANWYVVKRKALRKSTPMGARMGKLEHATVRIRAKAEHPFRMIKHQCGPTGPGQEHSAAARLVARDAGLSGPVNGLGAVKRNEITPERNWQTTNFCDLTSHAPMHAACESV